MLVPFYAALAVAFFFYLFIPLVGAFIVRKQWRRFRSRLEGLKRSPMLRYRDVAGADGAVGSFRLYGSIEALEGSERLWLRGEGVSALVDFSRSPLYVLGNEAGDPGSIARTPWKDVTALAEGTRMLVAGRLVVEGGKPVFVEALGEPLLAISYDCLDSELQPRLVRGGRAANEYWTPISQLSFAFGILAMSGVLFGLSGRIYLSTIRAMTFLLGGLPALIFAPPGLAFLFLYWRLWRKALSYRVVRDLYRMPLAFFGEGVVFPAQAPLPGGGSYVARRLGDRESPPPGALLPETAAPADVEPGQALLFVAEGSADPAATTLAAPGEPEELARAAERKASVAAAGAALSLALGALLNYGLGILLWRRLF